MANLQHQAKHDELLLNLARDHDNIESLLDTFFGFLGRKTDFFSVMTKQNDKMGFPTGVAEKMTLAAFKKHQTELLGSSSSSSSSAVHRSTPHKSPQVSGTSVSDSLCTTNGDGSGPRVSDAAAGDGTADHKDKDRTEKSSVVTKDDKSFYNHISTWNGGTTDRYRWTQTFTELTIEICLHEPPCSAKEIKVEVSPQKLKVVCRKTVLLEGILPHKVNTEDCVWVVEDNSRLVITLDKRSEMWWTQVLEGDPEIDGTTIESKKRIEQYPEDAQAVIRKIMFDQQQTLLGKPTSDELEQQGILKKAWNVEGSPFKGTEFDPSLLNMSS